MKLPKTTQFGGIRLLFLMIGACGCTRTGRESECQSLTADMRQLGTKLAATRRITSSDAASAPSVAIALDAYAKSAASSSETLAQANHKLPELAKLSSDASVVAGSLANAATKMVRAADRMKGSEKARNVARIQKSLAEVAVANLNRDCSSGSVTCAGLAEVLLRHPSFPDASVDSEAAATWTAKSNAWLDELAAVAVEGAEVKHQISNLVQTSRAFTSALATLAPGNDRARELAAATKEFGAEIARMQQVATAVEAFCNPP